MKKIIIKNKNGIERAGAEMLDPTEWITQCVAQNVWGKPERWILDTEPHDPADILETEVREEDGDLKTYVRLKAEYTIEVIDVSFDYALQECLSKRRAQYPTPEEFLNAFFDQGESGLEALKQKRLEIKAKFPKPVKE